ncbi:hypothetical protein L207DRAFT_515537 [Hyaloscypha variabilis F]|uniref:Uncharacterized protein n=1 Tax=Hyaloscypha variabilis (strain UAMH 11265 / GT02V1 / F) TaxID=1149755 RepID=A0A2J6RB93_HYAVF|nr:hypothetical protein L207DRAFT_515537 [Hyaloscypha variabilis F]
MSTVSEAHNDHAAHLTYINRIKESLNEQTSELKSLHEEVEARFKVHKSFCDCIAHRLFHRTAQAREEYEADSLKAEQNYFAALGAQSRAEARRAQLESDLEVAIRDREELERAVKEHDELRKEIDEMYERLFDGPTPGFPEEDAAEEAYKAAKEEHDITKERILKSRQALRLLHLAQERLPRAQKNLASAHKLGKEMWVFVDDTLISLRFGNKKLGEAATAVRDADIASLAPEVLSRKETLIMQLETAMVHPEKLHSWEATVEAIGSAHNILCDVKRTLKQLIQDIKEEERDGLSEINRTAKQFEFTKEELWLARQAIFEKVAGFGQAPPCYSYDKPAPDYSSILDEGHEHQHGCGFEIGIQI